jgi:hypothetical protein
MSGESTHLIIRDKVLRVGDDTRTLDPSDRRLCKCEAQVWILA